MADKIEPYNQDRSTEIECFDEDGVTPLFEDGKRITTTNREFSAHILENIIAGSELGREDEDADWLRGMFAGFEKHIAELRDELGCANPCGVCDHCLAKDG